MGRNQSLPDRLFSQQTDAELQRHIHSNSGLKQQPLHSTATKEHKRLVKEFIPMSTPGYDDPTKDHSGPAACQALFKFITPETSTSLVEGQCLHAKLPDTVNVAIQIGGKQVHERYATKQNDFDEKKNVPLEFAGIDLLATVGPRTIHVYDKLCVVVLSNGVALYIISNFDSYSVSFQTAVSRIYSNETSVIQTLQSYHPIIHVQFNQLINYLDPRLEYIRVIIIEWSTKFSIPIARIISADIQCNLLSARRCEGLDGYSQQVDWFNIRKTQITFFHRGT
ncbi:unnamed protein product [Rotaria socialis]|uniref:Uncharacterized protein n=1 Tax=Rotaria socialis TaxID=392032 RepID=A0A820SQE7_9BILA|nr:unnamed protein product [Rotaria socialis]